MTETDRPMPATPGARQSLTAGPAGPILLQDRYLTEKLAQFARERIPERVVHAKGAAAFGTLAITGDIRHLTKAAVLQPGKATEVMVRFSTFAGESGAADAERDVRGFALKAYTDEGNWDLVGSNMPVACIRDPLKFPDLAHAAKRHPVTHLRSATALWDFWSLSPESIHQVLMLFSDRGLPRSYRHMHGYGGHAFALVNEAGDHVWAKFRFRTLQGVETLSDAEAGRIVGQDRESSQRDLADAIRRGEPPRWGFELQIMTDAQARALPFGAFDCTRVWPHALCPPIELGILTLDRIPANYFAQVEQAAFSPSNLVPGICLSPDKLLQARAFAYPDAQRYRIGAHHPALAVNRPVGMEVPSPTDAYYEPNSFGGGTSRPPEEPTLAVDGTIARFDDARGSEDYRQAADLFRRMSPTQRQALLGNLATSLGSVPAVIQRRQIAHFMLVDPALGQGLRALLFP